MAKRIFISFAIEDAWARNLLAGQKQNPLNPIEYVDYSVKEPWSESWKTQCRIRIRSCRGVIALLSRNSLIASGQRWEIRCAVEERIPILGVYVRRDDTSSPPEMTGITTIYWDPDAITRFIDRL